MVLAFTRSAEGGTLGGFGMDVGEASRQCSLQTEGLESQDRELFLGAWVYVVQSQPWLMSSARGKSGRR